MFPWLRSHCASDYSILIFSVNLGHYVRLDRYSTIIPCRDLTERHDRLHLLRVRETWKHMKTHKQLNRSVSHCNKKTIRVTFPRLHISTSQHQHSAMLTLSSWGAIWAAVGQHLEEMGVFFCTLKCPEIECWLLHTVYVRCKIKEHLNATPMGFFPLISLYVSTIKAKIHSWILHVKKTAPPFCYVQPHTGGGSCISCISGFCSLYTVVQKISPAFNRCFFKIWKKKYITPLAPGLYIPAHTAALLLWQLHFLSSSLSLSRCRCLLCVEQWLMCRGGCVFSVLLGWCRVVWTPHKSSG